MGQTGKFRGTTAASIPSGANIQKLQRIIGSKSETLKAAGRTVDNERVAVIASLAKGTPAERAQLAQIYSAMSPDEQASLEKAVALSYRNPRTPGLTPEGQDILGALKGQGVSPDAGVAWDSPNLYKTGLEDPETPSPTNPRKKPEGFDPKEARVKDPSKDILEDRPPLRGPEYTYDVVEVTLPNGRVEKQLVAIPKLDEQGRPVGGRVGNADYPLIRKGEAYEKALEEGKPLPPKPTPLSDYDALASDKSPQKAYDEAVMAIVRGSMPQGRKGRTATGVYTPPSGQADHLMNIWNLLQLKGDGKVPAAPNGVFSSPRQMAEQIIRNTSPELLEMPSITPSQASDAKDSLFLAGNDLSVDKKGRLRASPKELTVSEASKALAQENPDLPVAKGKRKAYEDQAVERLTKEIESRFGNQWGENYKPGAAEVGEATDAPGITESAVESRMPPERGGDEAAKAEYADLAGYASWDDLLAHAKRMDAKNGGNMLEGVYKDYGGFLRGDAGSRPPRLGTSQDPNQIPQEGGRPNTKGTPNKDRLEVVSEEAPGGEVVQRVVSSPRLDEQGRPVRTEGRYVFDDPNVPPHARKVAEDALARDLEAVNAPEPETVREPRGKPAQPPLTHDEILRLRNPSQADLSARRDIAESKVFPFMPGLKDRAMDGGDLAETTAIRREMDSLNGMLENEPQDLVDLRAQLDAPGLTPARAKEIRDQLKEMYSARTSSTAIAESRLRELQDRLISAQQVDNMTGVLSARGRGKKKGGAGAKANPAPAPEAVSDASNTAPGTTINAVDDASVITPKPTPKDPWAAGLDNMARAEEEGVDDLVRMATEEDKADAAAQAAKNADEAEAPRDVESERPAAESATVPKKTGSDKTPDDKPVGEAGKPTWLGRAARVAAVGIPGIAMWNTAANRMSTDATGWEVDDGAGSGGDLRAAPAGMASGLGRDVAMTSPMDAPMTAEDRIRMLRAANGGRPVVPQTFFNWRG